MEGINNIKAKGLVMYFLVLCILFLSIAGGIAESNLGELLIGYEENNVTIDGADFSILATAFSGVAFFAIILFTVFFSSVISLIMLFISNLVFGNIYFKNIIFKKEDLLKDLNYIRLPTLIIPLLIIIFPNIGNDSVLLISSAIYYIVFWLLLYITLKSKINKVYIKEK